MDLQLIKNKHRIIGQNPQLNFAIEVALQAAKTDLSVLIIGESGVGKEAFSKIIHTNSQRKHYPFIAINCGALPEGTIDSELFGHEKGAFTGATDSRKGYFETTNEGTIFLDEIGEMPLSTQARLLRILESGEYIRVGSSEVKKTNVRIIAATNKNLLHLIDKGKFREDLYYRLSTIPIRVPALRNRQTDILLLFRFFANEFAEKYHTTPIHLDESAKEKLLHYPFPGNIRELKNIVERLSVFSENKKLIDITDIDKLVYMDVYDKTPVLFQSNQQNIIENEDNELLYKMFFELKNEVNEMKKVMVQIVQNGEIQPLTISSVDKILNHQERNSSSILIRPNDEIQKHKQPILLEENLNLASKEKEFIVKALQKHKGKRNKAAEELGISSRTLFRKIKEYNLEY